MMKKKNIEFRVFSSALSQIDKPMVVDIWVEFIETTKRRSDLFEERLFSTEVSGEIGGKFKYNSVGHVLKYVGRQDPHDPEMVFYYPVRLTLIHLFESIGQSRACISLGTIHSIEDDLLVIDIMRGVKEAYDDVGKRKPDLASPYVVYIQVEHALVKPLQERLDKWINEVE